MISDASRQSRLAFKQPQVGPYYDVAFQERDIMKQDSCMLTAADRK